MFSHIATTAQYPLCVIFRFRRWCERLINPDVEINLVKVLSLSDATRFEKCHSNFQTFRNFEELYDYVEKHIIGIKGVGAVMVYDVALCLGERMDPQVVPREYVYVHGKLIDAARHLFGLMKMPLRKVKHGHRISISYFEPLGIETLDKRYAARAIEEWLCNEAKNIARAKTIEELM